MRKTFFIPLVAGTLLLAGCTPTVVDDPNVDPVPTPDVPKTDESVMFDEGGFHWALESQFEGEYPAYCVETVEIPESLLAKINEKAKEDFKAFYGTALLTETPELWLLSVEVGDENSGGGAFFIAEGVDVNSLTNIIAADASARQYFDFKSDLTTKDPEGEKAYDAFSKYAACWWPLLESQKVPPPEGEPIESDVIADSEKATSGKGADE